MAWIRIEQSLVQNRKLYSLKSALRIDTAKAVGTLALLWLWAIDNARGGSLGRISDRQLAEICQFSPRRAAELRDALVSSGSLDPAGDDLVIHDWDDFGGRLEKRREWETAGQLSNTGTERPRAMELPLLPLRCDHLRLRISGSGDMRLHALHRYLETGSEL